MRLAQRVKEEIWNILFFALVVTLAVVIIYLIGTLREHPTEKRTRVGGVFIGSVSDKGWNESHYEGLKKVCDDMELPLEIVEYVDETDKGCRKAVAELAAKGVNVIFLTSDGFGADVTGVARDYPLIMFYTISPESDADNLVTYYGRMYQMRYLAGVVAGQMTQSNVLGYVAAMDNAQVDRGINAYLLGARLVNPEAVVKVRLMGSWFDSGKEQEAAKALIEEDGADVLTFHSSTANTVEVAEQEGVYSIGYNMVEDGYSERCLASLVFHWDVLYDAILRDFRKGSIHNQGDYWWGGEKNVVAIENLSPLIDQKLKRRLKKLRDGFEQGEDVFLGEIRRADGTVVCEKNERISDKALLHDMNWFVEGVEVNVP